MMNLHNQEQLDSLKELFHKLFILSPVTLENFYNTTAMARLFSDSTSAILFMLLGLAACITLATSALTAHRLHVRQATSDVNKLNEGVRYSVSYCRPCICTKLLAILIDVLHKSSPEPFKMIVSIY